MGECFCMNRFISMFRHSIRLLHWWTGHLLPRSYLHLYHWNDGNQPTDLQAYFCGNTVESERKPASGDVDFLHLLRRHRRIAENIQKSDVSSDIWWIVKSVCLTLNGTKLRRCWNCWFGRWRHPPPPPPPPPPLSNRCWWWTGLL